MTAQDGGEAEAPVLLKKRRRAATSLRGSLASDRRGADPWLGRLVDGRYKVEEVLGRGGMGVVYKIKHQRMGKIAAMKVLHSELATNSEVVRRFQLEAEAVSRLAHPNTVQVFDFGSEDGALYLVMEYVRGQDLAALVDRDGPIGFETLAPLLGQICGSLEEAHALGIVHRDLKPENILVSRTHSGRDFIKVLDFGLAKINEREESSAVTSAGSIVGTPYYMSPEQIRADEQIDHRADIYSFGALLYRLMTGNNVFNANTPVGVLTKHLTEVPPAPSKEYPGLEIDPELDQIIARCLEKNPDDRYPTVRALLDDIEKLYTSLFVHSGAVQGLPSDWLNDSGSSRAPVAAMMEVEVDHGIEANMRLRREDLDVFERTIRRRRRFRIVLIPLLLTLAVAGAVYLVMFRPEKIHEREAEPNNSINEATLISGEEPVTGYIGQRISTSVPDRDFFRFPSRPDAYRGQVISLRAAAPPNVDIEINVFDNAGKLIKKTNDSGIGQGEVLRRWRINRAVAVSVSGVLPEGDRQLPVENVSDQYELTVSFAPVDTRLESEPNDTRTDANPLEVGTPVTGHLDHRDDIDVFQIIGEAGEYSLLISGGPDAPFEWRLGESASWTKDMRTQITIESEALFEIRRVPSDGPLSGTDLPYTIDVSP